MPLAIDAGSLLIILMKIKGIIADNRMRVMPVSAWEGTCPVGMLSVLEAAKRAWEKHGGMLSPQSGRTGA